MMILINWWTQFKKNFLLIMGIIFFVLYVTALMTGHLITAFAKITSSNWEWILGLRVFLVVSLGIGLGLCMGSSKGAGSSSRLPITLFTVFLALLVSFNPLRDLLQGPVKVDGVLIEVTEEEGSVPRIANGSTTYSLIDTFHLSVNIENFNGRKVNLIASGLQANRASDILVNCSENSVVRGEFLLGIDVVLELSCEQNFFTP